MKRFIIVRHIDGTEQEFTDNDLPLTIGSGTENHIVLPESDPTGAYIESSQGHLFVQRADHTTLPFFHNDHLLSESVWLKSNDLLRSGSYVVHYERSGDRIIFSVTEARQPSASPVLTPPVHSPPETGKNNDTAEEIPVDIVRPKHGFRRKIIGLSVVGVVFLLLGCSVAFVLFARPLKLEIDPVADSVSVSGVPPAIKIGSRYLMLPGDYSLKIEKKGYVTFRQTVRVNKRSLNTLAVDLQKLPGMLDLHVNPADGVAVYSGSDLIATTPPGRISIEPGNHTLTFSKDRYKPFKTDLFIVGEETLQDLEVTLQPDWSDIAIISDPIHAHVSVDGTEYGQTPVTVQLLSGDHEVVLREELYAPVSNTITVRAGRNKTYSYQLTPLPGQVLLSSTPAGAVVTIENEYHGTTPLDITLPADRVHRLKLSRPGYKPLTHNLTVAPGEERTVQLNMEQEHGVIFLTITPVSARLAINGKSYEKIQGQLTLPATAHKIEVSSPGYKSESRTITPNPGFSQQVSIDLVAESGIDTSTPAVPGSQKAEKQKTAGTATGQKLVYIEPVPFTMGAPRREPGRRANEREREIIMAKPFLIGEKLVSNAEYGKFDKSHDSGSFGGYQLNGKQQPVVNITWDQAAAYANWLSKQDNLQPFYIQQGEHFVAASPPTNGYRLPTEAEWSYSARYSGKRDTKRYPWDGGFPPQTVVANFADESARAILPRVLQGYNDSFPVTSPVGSFPPNRAGLYDMGGNVSQWCHDYYSAYTGRLSKVPDPLGPSRGVHKVIRGSSWRDSSITEIRLSYRAYHKEAQNDVGFRIARYP